MPSASAIDGAIQRKMHGRGAVKAWKETTSDISNEDVYDIIKIIKSLKD